MGKCSLYYRPNIPKCMAVSGIFRSLRSHGKRLSGQWHHCHFRMNFILIYVYVDMRAYEILVKHLQEERRLRDLSLNCKIISNLFLMKRDLGSWKCVHWFRAGSICGLCEHCSVHVGYLRDRNSLFSWATISCLMTLVELFKSVCTWYVMCYVTLMLHILTLDLSRFCRTMKWNASYISN